MCFRTRDKVGWLVCGDEGIGSCPGGLLFVDSTPPRSLYEPRLPGFLLSSSLSAVPMPLYVDPLMGSGEMRPSSGKHLGADLEGMELVARCVPRILGVRVWAARYLV